MLKPSDFAGICVNTYKGEYGHVDIPGLTLVKDVTIGHSNVQFYETDNEFIIAFEGTHGKKDWIDNFKCLLVPVSWKDFWYSLKNVLLPLRGWPLRMMSHVLRDISGTFFFHPSVMIHLGFWQNYKVLRQEILWAVSQTTKKVSICGHSLGGANALLCRADLIRSTHCFMSTYTFGAPRVGNRDFYAYIVAASTVNFKNNNDIVTNVPFRVMGYYEPYRIRVSHGSKRWRGWTPIGNWKDHYPEKYYEGVKGKEMMAEIWEKAVNLSEQDEV